jgi:hypothetical protein
VRVSLQHEYRHDRWNVGARASFMNRYPNEFVPEFAAFVPNKTRWEVGAVAAYQQSALVRFEARVSRIWTKENPTPNVILPCCGEFLGTAIPTLRVNAWAFVLGGTVLFDSRRKP